MTIIGRFVSRVLWFVLPMLLAGMLQAQVDKATITGTVSDQSGAVIVGVKVTATNTDTGVRYTSESNEAGIYRVPALPIGTYSVDFEKSDFKKVTRKGLSLQIAQVAEINVQMQPGTVSQVVEVTTSAGMLETETSDVGTDMTAKSMEDMPLDFNVSGVGRDITGFIYSTVPTTNGGNWEGHIAGSQNMSKNVMVDGVDSTAGLQGFIQSVGTEAVQEMNVQVSGMTAEGAATGGGTVLLEMKSGTNQLHGSGFFFWENEALNANTWLNNAWTWTCGPNDPACPYRRPRDRFSSGGGSLGGPIWKNHTFLFGSYERFKNNQFLFTPDNVTEPTQAYLSGDFSALLQGPLMLNNNQNQLVQATDLCGRGINIGEIYNPLNPVVSGGNTCYQPFPNNKITSGLSPIAMSIAQNVYANGYTAAAGSKPYLNAANTSGYSGVTSTHLDLKLDHNINDKQRISLGYNDWNFASLSASGLWQTGSTTGGPLNSGDNQPQRDWALRVQHFYTLGPNLLNAASVGYTQHRAGDKPPAAYDPSKVGIQGTDGSNFPDITFADVLTAYEEQSVGSVYNDAYTPYNFVITDSVSWTRGRHNFKFGGNFEARGMNRDDQGGVRQYNFTSNTYAPTAGLLPDSSSPTGFDATTQVSSYVGFAFANFMLGQVENASQSVTSAVYGRRKSFSLYVSDDYKVTSRLTLNLGLRWDVNARFSEKYGHWSNFDIAVNRGLWGPYNGGWEWENVSGTPDFERNQNFHQFAPQLGVAYQAMHNLVLRGHYGITYSPLAMTQWSGVPAYYPPGFTAGAFGEEGTNVVVNNNNFVPAFSWDTAPGTYPGQAVYPARVPTQTNMSGGAAYVWPDALTMGRVQNWNVGGEYELGKGAVVTLNYMGNRGSNLHDGSIWPYNYPTQSAYMQLYDTNQENAWVQDQASAQAAGVPYPYTGFQGFAYEAISPYPQIASQNTTANTKLFLVNADIASSAYNAMIAEVKTKGTHGLTMDLNYTLSRTTGNSPNGAYNDAMGSTATTQDPYLAYHLTDQLQAFDITHQVKGYVLYDLPIGIGQRWKTGRGWLDNYALGGWTLGMQLTYNSGMPLGIPMAQGQYSGWSGVFAAVNRSLPVYSGTFKGVNPIWANTPSGPDPGSLYFNPNVFSQPANGQFGNYNYAYMGFLRGFGNKDEDLNIAKHFHFGPSERYSFSLRAQFFDVFNRHTWNAPSLDMTNLTTFGHVLGASGNRYGQLNARFEF